MSLCHVFKNSSNDLIKNGKFPQTRKKGGKGTGALNKMTTIKERPKLDLLQRSGKEGERLKKRLEKRLEKRCPQPCPLPFPTRIWNPSMPLKTGI